MTTIDLASIEDTNYLISKASSSWMFNPLVHSRVE